MSTIDVRLEDRSYQISVETGIRARCGSILRGFVGDAPGRKVLLIADEAVSETYAEEVTASLRRIRRRGM